MNVVKILSVKFCICFIYKTLTFLTEKNYIIKWFAYWGVYRSGPIMATCV